MLWTKGILYLVIGKVIPVTLITTTIMGLSTVEVKKKSKTFKVNVYMYNAHSTGHSITLNICLRDDDSKCHAGKSVNIKN